MKQLKDTEIKYNIKITILRKHFIEKGCHSNIPYLICCKIKQGDITTTTSFSYNKKGKNELIKFLKRECCL